MNALNIYAIAKELNLEEKLLLIKMLKKDVDILLNNTSKRKPVLTDEDALIYLLKNVFGKIK